LTSGIYSQIIFLRAFATRQAFLKLLALRKELRIVLVTIEQNPDAVEACLVPCEKVRFAFV
jgi:hypothetical protein